MSQLKNPALASILILALAACASTPSGTRGTPTPSSRAADENVALAQQYIQDGKYEIALGRLEHALSIDPRSANAHTMMGLLNERIGRDRQAGVSYRRAAELQPDRGDVLNNYGSWLCRQGQTQEALTWFERAVADPFYRSPSSALANAGACARLAGDLPKADEYLRRALQADANNPRVLQELAWVQYEKGDYMRARAFVQRREAAGPADGELLDLAARVEERIGNMDAANRYRSRLLTEFPEFRPSTPGS
jgi:type IV pilus assembly protein PilF